MSFNVRKIKSQIPRDRHSSKTVFRVRDLFGQYFRGELPLWFSAPVTLALAVSLGLVISLWRRPLPERNGNFLIAHNSVSRMFVTEKYSDRKQWLTGRPPIRRSVPFLPHHLTFDSTAHPVEIYVVRQTGAYPLEAVTQMLRLTEELEQGIPPQSIFAQASGMRGSIPLFHRPWGWTRLLVLVRAPVGKTAVEINTHYAP